MLLLLFACALVTGLLLSQRAERTVLSVSVLFLLVGVAAGEQTSGLLHIGPGDPLVSILADVALFIVLFTDGMKLSLREIAATIRLPARALIAGLPLTVAGIALLAHYLADLPWLESILLGGVLSPTDPVLASAIVGRQDIPHGLRHLLHIESGLNDGLALPVVLISLRVLEGKQLSVDSLAGEIAAALALGTLIPWAMIRLERSRFFGASERYTPLMPAAAGFLVFALCSVLHANEYLAAFTAGVTVATMHADLPDEFHQFLEPLSEMTKLAALMVFGALLSLPFFLEIPGSGYGFAALTLLVVRPAALGLALVGTKMPRAEFLAAAWFGPKGFASVVYALLVARTGIERADELFHLAALVTAASIILHSSTDTPISNWLARQPAAARPPDVPARRHRIRPCRP